jgi:hypothetical protein
VITCAVVAGLLLLPGRLLGPDQPVHVAVPLPQAAVSVQAAPPLLVVRKKQRPAPRKPTALLARAATRVSPQAAQPRVVAKVSKARRMLKAHRSAVISRLAPTAPLVRARQLAAVPLPRHAATKPATSTARTIAALGASLRKK